jgi:hypothetical protein
MTTIKRSYSGQWADQHAATRLATAEADERQAIDRMNGWTRVLVVLSIAPLLVALGLHLYFR